MARNPNSRRRHNSPNDMNRYGLRRYIEAAIAREVRQRCGFGCVICGAALVDYDHFDPEFAQARTHAAAGIVLLCDKHHGQKNRGFLSKETIRRAMQQPAAVRRGFSSDEFDFGNSWPDIRLGPAMVRLGRVILECNGNEVLKINPPEEPGAPFRVNATFRNQAGEITLQIADNIWQVRTGNWDAVQEGPRITIRRGPGDIVLILRTMPPNMLVVERLNMRTENYHIRLDGETLYATTPAGRTDVLQGIETGGGYNAIVVGTDGISLNRSIPATQRSDFPSPSIPRGPSTTHAVPPAPTAGRGYVTFSKPSIIGGATMGGFSVFGGEVRAVPGGGAEIGPSMPPPSPKKKDD